MMLFCLCMCLLGVCNVKAYAVEEGNEVEAVCPPCQEACSPTLPEKLTEPIAQIAETLVAKLELIADRLDALDTRMTRVEKDVEELVPPAAYKPTYRVFHFQSPQGRYKLTLNEARELCASKNMELATVSQMETAFDQGLNLCHCGWLDDGTARYAVQYGEAGCGGKRSKPGIRRCGWQSMWDAYCFNSMSLWTWA